MKLTIFLIIGLIFSFSSIAVVSGFDNQGMAITDTPLGVALINPSSGVATVGHEVSMDVLVHAEMTDSRLLPGMARFNDYTLELYFNPNEFEYLAAENLVEGLDVEEMSGEGGVIKIHALRAFDGYFSNVPTAIATVTFLPRRAAEGSEVTFQKLDLVNTYGGRGGKDEVIKELRSATYTIVESSDSRARSGGGGGGKCQPDCSGKECGTDGCGGFCGDCEGKSRCQNGQCECLANCDTHQCGSDGCGGSCGDCPAGMTCDESGSGNACVGEPTTGTKLQQEVTTKKPMSFNPWWIVVGLVLIIGGGVGLFFFLRKKPEVPV